MERQALDVPAAPVEGAWAPHVRPMLVYTVLMAVSMLLPNAALAVGGDAAAGAAAALVALVLTGWQAHVHYTRAKKALAEDPALKGRWLVENAWWLVVAIAMSLPILFAFAFVLMSLA